jgi:hypothetical protein
MISSEENLRQKMKDKYICPNILLQSTRVSVFHLRGQSKAEFATTSWSCKNIYAIVIGKYLNCQFTWRFQLNEESRLYYQKYHSYIGKVTRLYGRI